MSTTIKLKTDMLEQVMRVTSDDVDVIPFLYAESGSKEALAALGRLLSSANLHLVPGCPLIAWAQGGPVDQHWRMSYPGSQGCLWQNLEFLTRLYGPSDADNPYEKLEELRSRESQDIVFQS